MARSDCIGATALSLSLLLYLTYHHYPNHTVTPPPIIPPIDSSSSEPLEQQQQPASTAPTITTERRQLLSAAAPSRKQRDLVFGVVAFDPRVGCGTSCAAHREGVRRWASSVRRHTDPATTELALFTAHGKGSIARASAGTARALRDFGVVTYEGDFRDRAGRVAHDGTNSETPFVWCVVRNRWFVIRDHLRAHAGEYRHVLMSDVRDAIIQSDPFGWVPQQKSSGFELHRTVVFSAEGSGSVKTLAQSKKGLPRTVDCAGTTPPLSDSAREMLKSTDPLNAGVTLGGYAAFLNFSTSLADFISHVTTLSCLKIKDCTDQGLYNLLVYWRWEHYLPHTKRLIVPMEGGVLSYTLGHLKGKPLVDADGRVRDLSRSYLPPVIHQFAKGAAGKALKRNAAFSKLLEGLLDEEAGAATGGGGGGGGDGEKEGCRRCLMFDGSEASQRLASYCARHCSLTGG